MNSAWMKKRQTKYTVYATVYILVIIAVLAIVNVLAERYNKSYDATANKQFSLSDETKNVVTGLKDNLTITYFDRSEAFANSRGGSARDLLDRYGSLSSKVHVNYVDPEKKPDVAAKMGFEGTAGKIFVETAGRRKEANGLQEQEITGAIVRAVKGTERIACFDVGSGEPTLAEGLNVIKQVLESTNYKSQEIKLSDKAEIPKECMITVLAGPRVDLSEEASNVVKTFVENGGRLLVSLNPVVPQGGLTPPETVNLNKVLEGWGVTVGKDLIFELAPRRGLPGSGGTVFLVREYGTHPIVTGLKGLPTIFAMARSLDAKAAGKSSPDVLFKTSDEAFAMTEFNKDPDPERASNKKGPLPLAVAGTFDNGQKGNFGRYVVIGSSSWMRTQLMSMSNAADANLFLNIMNWLSSDEDLISIRPREPEDRRLNMSTRGATVLLYTCLLGFPLVVIVAGLGVWWRRR